MPVGSNPWNYNELPQHLKDYMAKNPFSYTKDGKTYYGADAFNMTDRRGQDHLITSWDARHLQNSIIANNNAARENAMKKNWEPYGGQYDSSASPEYYSNGIRKDAWKTMGYQAPNGMKDPVQISNGITTLWYDRSYGKPASEYRQSQSQQSPQQSQPRLVSANLPMTRMQSAISRAASSGRMGNNNLNLKMGQPIFNGQTGLMKNSGGSQLLNQMGFPSNQAGVPTQGARRPVPMPQRRKPNINAGLV